MVYNSLAAKSPSHKKMNIEHRILDVRRSMFDVQSVYWSGQAEFHQSTAVGLKSGWPDT
jgi:hypothetical protein